VIHRRLPQLIEKIPLVYELYGVTAEEVGVVEGRLKHERRERRRKARKGISRFSCPFVNFVVQIDALVYELHGLTEEEIEIVAGAGG